MSFDLEVYEDGEVKSVSMNAKQKKVFESARQSFNAIQEALFQERQSCLNDRRFAWISGASWEDFYNQLWANRPRLEINKVQNEIIRVINEYKANRISASFSMADGSKSSVDTDRLNDLYRGDRKRSGNGYMDNAFSDAITGGIGAWRLRAELEDDGDDEDDFQHVVFEPIVDADTSVFFDLNSKAQNKSDARECFVISSLARDYYESTYNDLPASWPKNEAASFFDWYTPDVVYICEYYCVEEVKETQHWFRALDDSIKKISEADYKDFEILDELKATGHHETRTKVIEKRKVHKYIFSGSGIIEDCGYIAGSYIPVIMMYGKRVFVNNVERCSGMVRICKDTVRLYQIQMSKLAEIASVSSFEKPILTPEQYVGRESLWADVAGDNPVMLINQIYDQNGQLVPSGPLNYTRAPQIPPALAQLITSTNQDLQDLTGRQMSSEEVKGNMSGLAVELIQAKVSMLTSGYMDNLKEAETWAATVWLSMAKEVYTEAGRKLKGITEAGSSEMIELKKPVINENGSPSLENDFESIEKIDVDVLIGPTSQSKRLATEKGLIGLMAVVQDPETNALLGNLILANSSGEGMDEIKPYFRSKMIKAGAIKPNEEETKLLMDEQEKEMQPPPLTEEQQANVDFLKSSSVKAAAEAEKITAETAQVNANTRKVLAETQKVLTEIENLAVKTQQLESSVSSMS